ncbi:MAG: leucine-rich repeat protein [Oscillospiraceae bacterium]|nr:leucine-rich repeat protein [Oscillospiraceae bacterium]
MKTFKRYLCLILTVAMLLGALPASALSSTQTRIDLSDLTPDARERVEYNLERYENFIAADPNLFLLSNYIRQEFALLDDEKYEYVRDLAFEITADCTTAEEEIYAVTKYLAENIYYGGSITHANAYEVLTDGYAQCSGYANAFNAMMQILGNPCVDVGSTKGDHEWNMVYNGSRWMLVDVCWARTAGSEKGDLVQGDGVNMEWYDFDLSLTYEVYHYIDVLPYSVVDGVLQTFPTRTDAKSFTIPSSVTAIGAAAFAFCEGLTSLTIPSSVTRIGDDAFADCVDLKSVTIPDSVTSIGKNAFNGCSSLTSVSLPDSITEIPYRAFEYTSLTEVTIPDSVTSIGTGAFENTYLKSITIPKSVTEIGDYAFLRCNDLASVYYEGSEADWEKITVGDGNHSLTNAIIYFGTDEGSEDEAGLSGEFGKGLAWNFTNGTLTVSGSGEMPAYHYGTGVNPPWYDWLEQVRSIVIKSGVRYVSKAFEYADNLKEVKVEEGVETIAWCAFYYCPALETVTLPKSIKSIEFDAFYGCDSLKTVYYQGSESQWNAIEWPTMEGDGEPHFLPSTRIVFLGTDDETEEDPCAQGHSWGDWETNRASTCTQKGQTVRECTVCGEEETKELPVTEHKYAAQETEDSVVYTCSVCGDRYTEAKEVVDTPTEEGLDNFQKTLAYTDETFGDVAANDWFRDNVRTVYEYGLMNGVGGDSFSPRGEITVAQTVTMAARLHNIYYGKDISFTASEGEAWYAPYVAFAEEVGILTESFDYDKTATREQFVYILSRALPAEVLPDIRGTISFADAQDIGYADAVELLVRAGVINGSDDGNGLCFLPLKSISRAEAAAVMSRMILPALRSAN